MNPRYGIIFSLNLKSIYFYRCLPEHNLCTTTVVCTVPVEARRHRVLSDCSYKQL